MSVTILDVAKSRGVEAIDGMIRGGEFDRVGLPMLSGCKKCASSLGPYNAYPSQTGWVMCGDCLGDQGFATVAEFEESEAEDDPELTTLNASEGVDRFDDGVHAQD